ncbi:hypothetical protein [Nostoc sp. PCC 7107]|uniref:hypothetical protein n=1 Tax=Nostoc sp. PCC 7107 TaxID=317936 RepID=UPI00029EE230|nr:hypothetical protein [Nostoc sp. PCC 7107]AFY43653.1 hypothetical protein Nos7107_3062 [Nostoc sp. PCC 7107]
MNKPIGYYTSYTPGDTGLLEDMQDEWGACFEKLSNAERLWMISQFADQLLNVQPKDQVISRLVEIAVAEAKSQLTVGDRLGLIRALADQINISPQ